MMYVVGGSSVRDCVRQAASTTLTVAATRCHPASKLVGHHELASQLTFAWEANRARLIKAIVKSGIENRAGIMNAINPFALMGLDQNGSNRPPRFS